MLIYIFHLLEVNDKILGNIKKKMKINTIPKAFLINSLVAGAISSLILETRLSWGLKKSKYKQTFLLTFLVNIIIFYLFFFMIGYVKSMLA